MASGDKFFPQPDEKTLREIEKSLGEDPDRLKKQIELFGEWLSCEPHLPKDVDSNLIVNFVRLCKCDLEKAKRKFEKFLAARTKLKEYYLVRNFDESYFERYQMQRQVIASYNLTPDGYRLLITRFPEDPEVFDINKLIHYGLLMLDYMLIDDIFAGGIFVYDLEHFSARHLAQVNIRVALNVMDLLFNISPLRVKQIYLVCVPTYAETVVNLIKKILTEKLRNRIIMLKDPKDLVKYVPKNVLPEDYGGDAMSIDEWGPLVRAFAFRNIGWRKKTENLKLIGPIPSGKEYLYSFDDCKMEGSFRQLSID